jgi:chromatin segregation and condensation protein Rec8/ScpA/Scc1 (kleisin family)
MEMSRIKSLPKEEKEDWKKELDNNRYVQEAIEINREQAFAEGVAEKEEAAINAYRKGKLNQLKANIASMKSNGMTEEEIKAILDLEELPD